MADAQTTYITVMILTRSLVLIIAALTGVLSIYLGWKLYYLSLSSSVEGEATYGKYKFRLASAGPGIFFALFGMALEIYCVSRQVEITPEPISNAAFNPAMGTILSGNKASESYANFTLAATVAPKVPACLVRPVSIKYFTGPSKLTRADLDEALSTSAAAISEYARVHRSNATDADKDRTNRALIVINAILKESGTI